MTERLRRIGRLKPTEAQVRAAENSPLKDQFAMLPDVIVVSGPSGTGKTTFAEELQKVVPGSLLMLGGEKFCELDRERKGENTAVVGYATRPKTIDQMLDDMQHTAIRTASENCEKYIIEARLGIVNATEEILAAEESGLMIPNVLRLLYTSNQEERMMRLVDRELRRQAENPELPQLTPEQIVHQTLNRERRDLVQWAKGHPILRTGEFDVETGKEILRDPYDPKVKDEHGIPVFYDYLIDTSGKPLLQNVVETLQMLEKNGHIIKLEDQQRFIEEGEFFPNPHGRLTMSL